MLLTLREMAAFGPAGREYPGKMRSLPSQNMQAEIETHYLEPIRALQQVIARPLIISVCRTAKGCNAQGEIAQAARYVVSETRKMGCISTMGGAIWSRLIAARDQDSDKLNGALAEPAWACLERDIFFQKILANAAISGRSSSGDARNMSQIQGLIDKGEADFAAKMEMFAPISATGHTIEHDINVTIQGRADEAEVNKGKDLVMEERLATMIHPEPIYEENRFWYTREEFLSARGSDGVSISESFCPNCKALTPMRAEAESIKEYPPVDAPQCPNCAAKWCVAQMNDSWKFFYEEAKEEALLAVVIRSVYQSTSTWRSPDAHPKNNLYRFMLEAMQALLFHEIGKRISNQGAIRVLLETAEAHITLSRNCQLDWRRVMGMSESTRVNSMDEEVRS